MSDNVTRQPGGASAEQRVLGRALGALLTEIFGAWGRYGVLTRDGWLRMRSLKEARLAIRLSCVGLGWQYGPRMKMPSGRTWIPDFFVPAIDLFVEVLSNREHQKSTGALEAITAGYRVAIMRETKPDKIDAWIRRARAIWGRGRCINGN